MHDPPIPVPLHLAPQAGPLELESDQQIVLTRAELSAIFVALAEIKGGAISLRVLHRDGSPWIELDVVTYPDDGDDPIVLERVHIERLALWRYTCAVYRLDARGAVEDDPIYDPRS